MIIALVRATGWTFAFLMVIAVMPTGTAQAYLDPGSGSLVVQILIAGILGLLIAVKVYWHKIIGFVTGKKSVEDAETTSVMADQSHSPGDDQS